jgi:hypothetical protein
MLSGSLGVVKRAPGKNLRSNSLFALRQLAPG